MKAKALQIVTRADRDKLPQREVSHDGSPFIFRLPGGGHLTLFRNSPDEAMEDGKKVLRGLRAIPENFTLPDEEHFI